MFDSPAPASISDPQPLQQPEPTPTWSGQAIREAMPPPTNTLATTLPEPTRNAIREECTMGVVAAARVAEPAEPKPETVEQQSGLEDFPAIGALFRNTQKSPRKITSKRKRGVLSRLANRGKKALVRTDTGSKQRNRPVKIEGDDYADVYGDDDGFSNGEYREVSMRSGQILRLRSDQDHQAEVAERIKSLSKSTGGDITEDEMDSLVQRLSESGDLGPIANLLKAAETKQLSFGQMASTSPPKETPGHHGISRMG